MKEGTSARDIILISLALSGDVGEVASYNKRALSSKFSTQHTRRQLQNTRGHNFVSPRPVSMSAFAAAPFADASVHARRQRVHEAVLSCCQVWNTMMLR